MSDFFEKLSSAKTHKLRYYLQAWLSHQTAPWLRQAKRSTLEAYLERLDSARTSERIQYYARIDHPFTVSPTAYRQSTFSRHSPMSSLRPNDFSRINSTYYFDLLKSLDLFDGDLQFDGVFGDVIDEPKVPAIVKSRPIHGGAQHFGILQKLDALRHFRFLQDPTPWSSKRPEAVFRGPCYQPHRQRFVERCHMLANTNIGDIRPDQQGQTSYKPPLTIAEHLRYRYIISVEGNDVATNLKWIMSSQSICMMTRPRYETWFMEGQLKPNYHYVLLNDDYSDLSDKIQYYNDHPIEAEQIVHQAQDWVKQFQEPQLESALAFAVLLRYFRLSGQLGR